MDVAVDISGYRKPSIWRYGLYSGGKSLAAKRAAIEKLRCEGQFGTVSVSEILDHHYQLGPHSAGKVFEFWIVDRRHRR